jgi:hypothetical protein
MATTTPAAAVVQMIALDAIRHDQNVRQQLQPEEVDALASSIALLGQLTPVSVRADTETGTGFCSHHVAHAARRAEAARAHRDPGGDSAGRGDRGGGESS